MTTPISEAPAQPEPSAEYQETIVKRDGNRPIAFVGKILATASMTNLARYESTATLYQTRGGKYVSAFSRINAIVGVLGMIADSDAPPAEFHKAQVFDSFDDALAWFRPGRLTDALRQKLGLDEPERIE